VSIAFWASLLTSVTLSFFFFGSSKKSFVSFPLVIFTFVAKKASFTESIFGNVPSFTLVFVGMTYAWFTLLSGTPFSLYGPVTRSNPLSNCLRKITLLPLNLPLRSINT